MTGKSIKTKWGTAKVNAHGYYTITSVKEGYHHKILHRLIWEETHNCKIPKGYVIHHKNKNKLDNRPENLECLPLSTHASLHNKKENNFYYNKKEENPMYGRKHSSESKKKMSENQWLKNGGEHPRGMKGKHHSEETKEHLRECLTKNYARITKGGINKQGKQKYGIALKGKIIKYSIHPSKLVNWFTKEYPNTIIQIRRI